MGLLDLHVHRPEGRKKASTPEGKGGRPRVEGGKWCRSLVILAVTLLPEPQSSDLYSEPHNFVPYLPSGQQRREYEVRTVNLFGRDLALGSDEL